MRELMGGEADELLASLEGEPATGLRVNTLKLTPADFERLLPWRLEPVPWCPDGFLVPAQERPGLHPFHAAGLYYLQEPSAMAAAQALAPRSGELVLDLAAAPGGKSTHLSALLGDDGVLVANDVSAARARELSRNLERWGSSRTVVTSAAVSDLARAWGARFDAVLLDAPCSGEGMFRKTPQALEQWTPELVTSCGARQDALMAEAAQLVRPGGRLVYSTCTFDPEENERVVAGFLAGNGGWELRSAGLAGVDSGRPEWAPAGSHELTRTARLWPHRVAGEGHFVALLERSEEGPLEATGTAVARQRRARAGRRRGGTGVREAEGLWREFVVDNLRVDPFPEHELALKSDGLYALPPGAPSLDGLRALRPGIWLGKVEYGRFAPAHGLAMTLTVDQALRVVDLRAEEPRLHSFLTGMELEVAGDDGWLVVAVEGHPLGWGRRARDIVKNQYPKGLRRPPGSGRQQEQRRGKGLA